VTSLPTGTYQWRWTNVDAGGGESHPSSNYSSGAMTNGSSKPRVTFAALPSGVVSRNLYLTNTGGAAGTEKLYATGITGTTYDLTSASWMDGTTTYAAATALPDKVAIRVAATGTFINGSTGNLTVNGDVVLGNTNITLNGGSVWEWDASGANSPSNTSYAFWFGSAASQTNCKLLTSGTSSGSRAIMRSNVSGANARFAPNWFAFGNLSGVGQVDVAYVDFTRMGTASVSFMIWTGTTGGTYKFDHCTFTSCGDLTGAAASGTDVILFRDNTVTTPVGAAGGFAWTISAAKTGGSREISGNRFDTLIAFPSLTGVLCSDNYFAKGFSCSGGLDWDSASTSNFIRKVGAGISGDATPMGSCTDFYVFEDPTGGTDLNPHFIGFAARSSATYDLTGFIFQYTGSDGTGDCFLHISGTGTVNLKNAIGLPNAALDNPGTCLTIGADVSTVTINIEHCTWHIGSQAMVHYNEGTPKDHTGMIGSLKSNLVYDETGASRPGGINYIICDIFNRSNPQTITPADVVSAAAADYNGLYQVKTGGYKGAYNANITGTPGAHDVSLDASGGPSFVDSARNLAKWDLSLGGAGTNAAALARIQVDPTLTRTSLIPYVKAGFVVQNSLLNNAGHDGATIGAQGYQSAASAHAPFFFTMLQNAG